MWRVIRIAVLLFILATVAQGAWLARSRTAEWNNTLRVTIYPINADGGQATARYIEGLRNASFGPIEVFFRDEGKKHGVALRQPVEVRIAPPVSSQPPAAPFGGSKPEVILWSLKVRYWAYRNDAYRGPKPDVRVFVSYHDPAARQRLSHSTGLQKGLLGLVNAFASDDMAGSNNVIIAHELLHALGATDKYDFKGNLPLFPDGYADPRAEPLHPQTQAEIMAGRIPVSETQAEIPAGMDDVVIGARTAREINWSK
ncbi:MAG: hypothetical protein HYV99_05050 [Betaproteobacteria bacterium]|nr:hypothetical protein [Betaproteobacteria bacterium]MBI2509339.1 hypothetical protein [Betaproteobacteria bacterium]